MTRPHSANRRPARSTFLLVESLADRRLLSVMTPFQGPAAPVSPSPVADPTIAQAAPPPSVMDSAPADPATPPDQPAPADQTPTPAPNNAGSDQPNGGLDPSNSASSDPGTQPPPNDPVADSAHPAND